VPKGTPGDVIQKLNASAGLPRPRPIQLQDAAELLDGLLINVLAHLDAQQVLYGSLVAQDEIYEVLQVLGLD
jgi:hypothetical protein